MKSFAQRTPADRRERAVETAFQTTQRLGQRSVDDDSVGTRREIEQRAVDIDEECKRRRIGARRRGKVVFGGCGMSGMHGEGDFAQNGRVRTAAFARIRALLSLRMYGN